MTSMLVFAIAFAVGCLSGVVIALLSARSRTGRPGHAPSIWPVDDDESTTVQRLMRR
jgi:hypothetical protein